MLAETFVVESITVEGNKRISDGTVFNYLPINVGERFDDSISSKLIKDLFATGFFQNIKLLRSGNQLIVRVDERPSIGEVNFSGNSDIPDDQIEEFLEQQGMSKGRLFNEHLLERFELEFQNYYYSSGKYAAKVDASYSDLDEDRVVIDITISEGESAAIKSINITGNEQFSDEELLDLFDMETSDDGIWPNDDYSSAGLAADLDKLKSHYFSQGYSRFTVESQQVSISPDRSEISITINVVEGPQFFVGDIAIAGEEVVAFEDLEALITIESGEVMSSKIVTDLVQSIEARLGEAGYAYADVQPVLEERDGNLLDLQLVLRPGNKMRVRYINFIGNDRTRDYVLRREMRQLEGEIYRHSKVERSKVRLQRLNYLGSVKLQKKPVPGSNDLLDLDVTVEERFSGELKLGLGYSQVQGVIISAGVLHDNVFGTGNSMSFDFDNNSSTERYGFSYVNPYYTQDGVSRGFNFSYTKTDAAEENISNYLIDRLKFSINYGIPLSEFNTLGLEIGAIGNQLTVTENSSTEVLDFIRYNSDLYDATTPDVDVNGDDFNSLFTSVRFSKDTRNRRIFAESGALNSVQMELYGGDLDFYKLFYRHESAFLLGEGVIFAFKSRVSYGESYGTTTDLPFFEKFNAGGVRSVRGYVGNSLGPRDSNGEAFGGNLRILTNTELLLPYEALGSSDTFRVALYFDAGNAFTDADAFEAGDLRQSVGVSLKWFSVVGPIEFSYALPNDKPGDDTQTVQFALGASF